ncbi:hypothetical protein F2P56_003084 [Juglans regia]|uniref:Retrotransposon Copia-like N-terminal domain-containing protein n=1 Tax=Juglans regia TaxID=51240 RepID=A0A833YG52_JUGRE|nr:hypothetical protein F2P56_003084 [Juglans regia]
MSSEIRDSLMFRFNGKNYAAWSFQFQLLVKGNELWDHIDGSSMAPEDKDQRASWKNNDARVMYWIFGSVDPHIFLNLRLFKNVRDMWNHLKRLYTQNNAARRFQVELEMSNFSQGALSIEEFYSDFVTCGLRIQILYTLQF